MYIARNIPPASDREFNHESSFATNLNNAHEKIRYII